MAIATSSSLTTGSNSAWGNSKSEALYKQALKEVAESATEDIALVHIDQALAIDATNPVYWQVKAQVLQAMEESEKALPCITKSLDLYPHSAEGYSVKAQVLNSLGKGEQALIAIDQALKFCDSPYYHSVRATVFRNQLKYEQAEKELDKVIAASPNDKMARTQRATVAALLKHWQKALDDLAFTMKEAKAKNVSYCQDLIARAQIYYATKQYDKAIADCNEGTKAQPSMRQFPAILLKIYTLKGNKVGAETARKRLNAIDDDFKPIESTKF